MPPEDRDAAHLLDMLNAARAVLTFVGQRTWEQYRDDELLQAAVERKIEIIGEAARRLSTTFQQAHPEVPWRKIMAQRHVLAHDYGEVDHVILWRVVSVHIPQLVDQIAPLIPPLPPDPEPGS